MKTLLLISNAVPHYRVSVYNYLAKRFNERGWRFVVASDAMQSQSRATARFDFRQEPLRFFRYRRLIREFKPDAVMFHLHIKDVLFWQLVHWLKWKRIPIVTWTKGANLDRPASRLRYHLFNHFHRLSDAIVLYSRNQMSVVKPRNRGKIFAANNTVNFADYPDIPESQAQLRTELGIPFRKVALFAGTMGVQGDRKKVDHLIEVFRTLDRPDVGLVLVGGGLSAERKARLNPRNTLYLGEVHDPENRQISRIFKAADVFVIPGHVGLAVNQAFYWGLPVVTEDGLHPPEIQYLKSGQTGFIVPENDLAALRDKMLYLLDNDDVRREFSARAAADIRREASIENMFAAFTDAVEFARARVAGTSWAPAAVRT